MKNIGEEGCASENKSLRDLLQWACLSHGSGTNKDAWKEVVGEFKHKNRGAQIVYQKAIM